MNCIILISVVVYLFSTICAWLIFHKNYNKGGLWDDLEPDFSDIFVMFCPIINTLFIVSSLFKSFSFNKFFKIDT